MKNTLSIEELQLVLKSALVDYELFQDNGNIQSAQSGAERYGIELSWESLELY